MIYGLPERLRDLREKSGMSQHEVAKRLNLAAATLSGYECGDRTPSLPKILSISYIYNCSVDYLLGKKPDDISHIFIDVTELSDEQRKAINELIKVMKSSAT